MPRPSKKQDITKFAMFPEFVYAFMKAYSLYDDLRFNRDAFYKKFILIWIHSATILIEPVYVAVTIYMIPTHEFDELINKELTSAWMYFRHKCLYVV